jgi:hypothetical protein
MTWNRAGMIRGDVTLTAELELGAVPARAAAPDDVAERQPALPGS